MTTFSPPPLSPASVHVWCLDLAPPPDSPDRTVLSPDELERSARYRFDRDRNRFVTSRITLRRILAGYLNIAPAQITFAYSSNGKPSLASPVSDLCFSVSHSHELGVIAVTRGHQVGIDVEHHRSDVEIDALAARFFSSYECESLHKIAAHDRARAFFQIWTAKEAFVKAVGAGLSLPLDSFDVGLDAQGSVSLLATRPDPAPARCWHLQTLALANGYAAALATHRELEPPIIRSWGRP